MRTPYLALAPFQSAPEVENAESASDALTFWESLGQPSLWATKFADFLPNLLRAVLVLALFWALLRIALPSLRRLLARAHVDTALAAMLVDNLLRYAVWIFAAVMAASEIGIDVTAAVAGLGVAGLAVGLAAQDPIANAIAGVTILLDRPFSVGQWVTVVDVTGEVAEIKIRTTRIRTRQNKFLVIPNKQIVDSVIVNISMRGDVRVDIPIGIAYKEKVQQAREVILAAMQSIDLIERPRSEVVVVALGSSSVDLELRVWVRKAEDEAQAHVVCLEAAKAALDRAGIQIPFPHLQLFVDTVEERAVESLQRALGR